MLPSAKAILDGWPFVARRLGLDSAANPRAVEGALVHAAELAASHDDEPAALFYAFGCRPRAFPGAWRAMPRILAGNQARASGLRLRASTPELDELCKRLVSADRPSFDDVRAWFTARLEPRE